MPTDLPTVDLQTAATGSSLRDKGDVHVYAHPKSKSAQLPKDRAEVHCGRNAALHCHSRVGNNL